MLRIPHFLDSRHTDGGKVVSPTRRPLLYSPETLLEIAVYYENRTKHVSTLFGKIHCLYGKKKGVKCSNYEA
jgi:hypothetical protein